MSNRVAILTGGGDVPGLNMCIKSLVYRLVDFGFEPIGVRKGWEGLINYNYRDRSTYGTNFIELTKNIVRAIDRNPGSFLHSSRVNPMRLPRQQVPEFLQDPALETQDLSEHIIDAIQRLGFKALIVIGDDDMLYYAAHLSQKGVPIIAIPKTIHNNIHGTEYTLGFSTGLARGVSFIHELRALASSREQTAVVETFGINSGYSSLMMAFLAGADRVIIPEVAYDPEKLAALTMQDKAQNPNNYAIVMVSDGSRIVAEKIARYTPHLSLRSKSAVLQSMTAEKARALREEFDLEGVVETGTSIAGSGMVVAELLQHLTGQEVFLQSLHYLLRTGSPDGQDLLGAANFAMLAARLMKEGKFARMTAFQQIHTWTDVDLSIVMQGVRTVDVAQMYDVDAYRPKVTVIWAA
ncbi:MAG: 6-phosphofructokinase [Anaerolineae bacterium]